jgi:hypothetical protein
MSSRIPFKKGSARSSISPTKSNFTPVEDEPRLRRSYGSLSTVTGTTGLLYAPGGPYRQMSDPGLQSLHHEEVSEPLAGDHDVLSVNPAVSLKKKEKQWIKWEQEIIPLMLVPYLELLRVTESLRNMREVRAQPRCSGCYGTRQLSVACIYFDSVFLFSHLRCHPYIVFSDIETIMICTCQPVAIQLLSQGLFPCAPYYPSLAVDLNMLDLVSGLFVNTAPNATGWCDTLETFLEARRYKLSTKVSLLSL